MRRPATPGSSRISRYTQTGRPPSAVGRGYTGPSAAPVAPANPGSGNYRGYDPRLYEAPPQSAPSPVAPTPVTPAPDAPPDDGGDEPLPPSSPDPDQP